ncbi:MAG: DUF1786 domain-containing protein [Bacillota bacterium]|nr:DUF1786 domain-containing protein [Bacillota bacterium]
MDNKQERKILAIDIGGGTQDIILYEEGKTPENFIQLVLPSPTVITASKIIKVTEAGKGLHLSGTIMGGGSCVAAIKEHLNAGLPVTAEEEAAKTIKDDLDKVRKLGIKITDSPPHGFQVVEMKDVDLKTLGHILDFYYVELPREVAVAVQDHGEAPPGKSNRDVRFQHWRNFIQGGGKVADLAYLTPPDYLTRMKAVQKTVPAALVMDTCSAAVWGSFADEVIKNSLQKGVVLVNIGNQHTFAALVKEDRIFGLFEHHTRMLNTDKLNKLIGKLCRKELTHEEVFDDRGHGCYIHEETPSSFEFVGVTGPRRSMAQGLGFYMVNPHGDMMMTGCFGLLEAAKNKI